jgi:hypothetical protein
MNDLMALLLPRTDLVAALTVCLIYLVINWTTRQKTLVLLLIYSLMHFYLSTVYMWHSSASTASGELLALQTFFFRRESLTFCTQEGGGWIKPVYNGWPSTTNHDVIFGCLEAEAQEVLDNISYTVLEF